MKFHYDPKQLLLFSAADDYKLRVWDLKTSKCVMHIAKYMI